MLVGGVGRLVIEQVDPLDQPRSLGRVVRVGEVGVAAGRVGTVGQLLVGENRPVLQFDRLAPLGGGDSGDREAVLLDLGFVHVQRRLLLAKEESGRRHPVAQRHGPYLQRAVLVEQGVGRGVHLRPLDRIPRIGIEVAEVMLQQRAERGRGEDLERGPSPVERQRGE